MLFSASLILFSLGAGALLWRKGRDEHQAALRWREGLLVEAERHFPGSRVAPGPDGFPKLSATLPCGSTLGIELITDTLVTRRLPQLWIAVSVLAPRPERQFALGALARPTGAEFYAMTHAMPDWLPPPPDLPLLVRGRGCDGPVAARASALLAKMFADPQLKEAVATPRGVRIVRQAAQGERGAHLLLRQSRFLLDAVPLALIRTALADAHALRDGLARQAEQATQAA